MTEDDFDVEKLRLRPEDIAAYVGKAGAAARPRRQDQFVIVPMAWADQLKAARYTSTYRLALDLLHQHWKNGGQTIALTNVVSLKNAGVSRGQKWRALSELERLKLVAVERRPRKSPRVTLLKTRAIKG